VNLFNLLQNACCGGLAAAGFGVLFNVKFRTLPFCAISGVVALMVRTIALAFGCGMEASSFVAALALGISLQLLPPSIGASRNVFHVVGCIPMIPGAFAAKAILGLFASIASTSLPDDSLITAIRSALRAVFILGALGTGLAIPTLIFRNRTDVQQLSTHGVDGHETLLSA